MNPKTPQEGIVRSLVAIYNDKRNLNYTQKDMLWQNLNWVIDNEKDNKTLADMYVLRAEIYCGKIKGMFDK